MIRLASLAQGVWQDVRHAVGLWAGHPGLSAAVLTSLMLSIGAATAVFTVADVLLLRPLPVRAPEELHAVGPANAATNLNLEPRYFSLPFHREIAGSDQQFRDTRIGDTGIGDTRVRDARLGDISSRHISFRDVIASSVAVSSGVQVSADGASARLRAELVSGNYFRVLGRPARLGRTIDDADDRFDGAHPVAVLSDHAWRHAFLRRPDIVGLPVQLNGHPFTVIGVMDERFFGTRPGFTPDLWVPLAMTTQMTGDLKPSRDTNYIELMIRVPKAASIDATEQALTAAFRRFLAPSPDAPSAGAAASSAAPPGPAASGATATAATRATTAAAAPTARIAHQPLPSLRLVPAGKGLSLLRGQYGQPLVILLSAVGLLLIIACANIANLLLARGIARRRELAIRLSQGATRLRLTRQLVTECLVLTIAGGALGWCAALAIGQGLLAFLPGNAAAWQFSPNLRAFLFTTGIVTLAGLLFGLVPSRIAARLDVSQALRKEAGEGRLPFRVDTQSVLSALQIGLSLVLVVASILFARSLHNIRAMDAGFQPRHLLLAALDPQRSGYPDARARLFYDDLLTRLRAQPAVRAAGLASFGSLSGVLAVGTRFTNTPMHADDQNLPAGADAIVYMNNITPGYLDAVGLPILRGRDFTRRDAEQAPRVAIVNETAARYFFGDANPVGRRIGAGHRGPADLEVVGVVRDAKYLNLREETRRTVYRPHAQTFRSYMTLHVSTGGDPAALVPIVRQAVRALDPSLPVFAVQTMRERIDESLRQERLVAALAGALSVLAALLAIVGVYSVVNYAVTRRTRELAIRIAVGATPRHVLASVLRRALAIALCGLAAGVPLALASTALYRTLLFGVSGGDPTIVAGAAAALILLALAAACLPARRAIRIEPIGALRQD